MKSKESLLLEKVKLNNNIPTHIAIIMDGNGRWAKERGKNRSFGHKEGINSVREIIEACIEVGVKYLTLYTFSTENWKRPKTEISTLMTLLVHSLKRETMKLLRNNVRLNVIGDLSSFPEKVQNEVAESIEKLGKNTGLVLNLALSYSGRWDIIQAVKKISQKVESGELKLDNITSEIFSDYLETKNIPDPDLLIRTSGEFRLSNFLLWQIAYSEIFISPNCWPEFRKKLLFEAILDYQKRERRFGLVSEQLKN